MPRSHRTYQHAGHFVDQDVDAGSVRQLRHALPEPGRLGGRRVLDGRLLFARLLGLGRVMHAPVEESDVAVAELEDFLGVQLLQLGADPLARLVVALVDHGEHAQRLAALAGVLHALEDGGVVQVRLRDGDHQDERVAAQQVLLKQPQRALRHLVLVLQGGPHDAGEIQQREILGGIEGNGGGRTLLVPKGEDR